MNTIVFSKPRHLTNADRLAWFKFKAAMAGLSAPNTMRWRWYA